MSFSARRSEAPYAQVANNVLNDSSLSLKAKGLYAYMFSKPVEWDFSFLRIAKDHSDGKEAVRTGLLELEQAGYLAREKQTDGKTVYILTHEPSSDNQIKVINEPSSDFPNLAKSLVPEIGTILKTDTTHIKTETESNTAANAEEINSVLNAFKKNLNPYIRFNNKTERKAASELIQELGLSQVLEHIKDAERFSEDNFAPRITTPYELKTKLAKLILHKKKNSPKTVTERKLTEKQQKEMNEYGFLTTN